MKKLFGYIAIAVCVFATAFAAGIVSQRLCDRQMGTQYSESALSTVKTEIIEEGGMPEEVDGKGMEEALCEDEIFSKLSEAYWSDITAGELEELTRELGALIAEDLELERLPRVELIFDGNVDYSGTHYGDLCLIKINLYYIFSSDEPYSYYVRVLAHEYRHAYQKMRVEQGYDTKLEYSYNNYISPEVDEDAYYSQLAERDARNYGEFWEKLVIMRRDG